MKDEIELLLPYYINGTLSDQEKAKVDNALQTSPELQAELQFLLNLQSHIKDKVSNEPSPGQMGLKRLQRNIQRQQKQASIKHWRYAAIAASVLLAIQTSLNVFSPTPDIYTPASSSQPAGILLVTFDPDATEAQIREILLNNHLSIIEGPSAVGIYKVAGSVDLAAIVEQLNQSTIVESVQQNQ